MSLKRKELSWATQLRHTQTGVWLRQTTGCTMLSPMQMMMITTVVWLVGDPVLRRNVWSAE